MPQTHFTTIAQMETDTATLREMAVKAGAETWEDRAKGQTPHCKFGEDGICCKNCSMGPCRVTPKGQRGICGADANAIAGRNYLRTIAAGTSAHSDHARELLHILHQASPGGSYHIRDEAKLLRLAREWGVATEGRDSYEIAHEVAEIGLMEFGKPFGTQRFINRAIPSRQKIWQEQGIEPRAIDREIATALHMTHMGNTADAEALVRQGLRTSLSNGWGGSMLGTEVTDIMFGTPEIRNTEGNLGVLERDMVNIVVHGHDPAFSEMMVTAAELKEMTTYAKSKGAKGLNLVGLCCTANEVAMRHGVRMAGNFLQQENAILTGVVEMMCVDIQCIFPALATLSTCFHTKFVTSSPIARIPGSIYVEFKP
jgi:carbon-monoxide dehydrogenase catalytic subunit